MARAAILALLSLIVAATARAQTPADDSIDDPKLSRRLGSRTTIGALAGAAAPPLAVTPSVASASVLPAPSRAPVEPSRSSGPSAPSDPALATIASDRVGGGVPTGPGDTLSRVDRASSRTPVVGIGFRRFSFLQVGASDSSSTTGAAASEAFNSVSLDFYPISRLIRWGLSTQYGWQDGRFGGGDGDYFIAQSSSLGVQIAGPTVTPFAEAFAGGGYMRRFQFDHTIPTAYWQFGVDAGANIFLGEHGFFSLAVGYLRPINGFLKEQSFTSVYVDTWSFKLGFGL